MYVDYYLIIGVVLAFIVPALLLNERLPTFGLVKRFTIFATLQSQVSELLDWASIPLPPPSSGPVSSSSPSS
jgi:hypothetical protein